MPVALPGLSRRRFIQVAAAAGGGLVIGLSLHAVAPRIIKRRRGGADLFEWVVIAPDNTATVRIAQMEMGQGTITAMAQLLAEELELDWARVRTEFISIAAHLAKGKLFGRTETSTSLGVHDSQLMLRMAGAQLRLMLTQAAAERLAAPLHELKAERSLVTHLPSGRRLTYAELAADAVNVSPPDPRRIALKPPESWRLIGKPMPRLDVTQKTDGSARFGIDVQLPGLKHAAIRISPTFGGTLRAFDAFAVAHMPGVRKVVAIRGGEAGLIAGMDDAVAVVADSFWQAKRALDALPVTWDAGPHATLNSRDILDDLRKGLDEAPTLTLRDDGDAEAALRRAAKTLKAVYFAPFAEHATMEPMNCTALVTDDRFEVWAPTQRPENAIAVAAEIAGMSRRQGEPHVTLIGGGFGRRQTSDYVSQAVQIAKQMKGTPVKLTVSREETTRHGFYRPALLARLSAGLDGSGNLFAWRHRLVCHSTEPTYASYGADSLLYAIPHMRVDLVAHPSPVPLGRLRSVSYGPNCFFTQCFLDEIARGGPRHLSLHARASRSRARAGQCAQGGVGRRFLARRARGAPAQRARRGGGARQLGRAARAPSRPGHCGRGGGELLLCLRGRRDP